MPEPAFYEIPQPPQLLRIDPFVPAAKLDERFIDESPEAATSGPCVGKRCKGTGFVRKHLGTMSENPYSAEMGLLPKGVAAKGATKGSLVPAREGGWVCDWHFWNPISDVRPD